MNNTHTPSRTLRRPPTASHQGEVTCCAFAPGQTWAVSGGWDGQVVQWDRATGEQITSWRAGDKPVTACAVAPDGRRVVTGSMDGLLAEWDVTTQRRLSLFLAHTRPISAIVFAPDGQHFATSSWDRSIILWAAGRDRTNKTMAGHQDIVAGCRFTPDGRELVSWSYDGTLRRWETARACQLACWTAHPDRVTAGDVSPDGRWFASGSRDGSVALWDRATNQEVARQTAGPHEIRGCFFSPDAELLFAVPAQGEILTYRVPELASHTGQETGLAVQCASLLPTGEQLALGTDEGRLEFITLDAMADRPICVTAVETHEDRPGFLARLLGRQQFQRVFRCTCPICARLFELKSTDRRTAVCPACKRQLHVNQFTLFAPR